MLFGIGFLTVITAAITSTFVARSRKRFEFRSPDGGAAPCSSTSNSGSSTSGSNGSKPP